MTGKKYYYATYKKSNLDGVEGGINALKALVTEFNKTNGTNATFSEHKNSLICHAGDFGSQLMRDRFEVICEHENNLKAEYIS